MNTTKMTVKQMRTDIIPSPNFAFLELDSPQLVQLGTLAEQHYSYATSATEVWKKVHSAMCLVVLRSFGELLARMIARKVGIDDVSGEDMFAQVLRRLQERRSIGIWTKNRFHSIRRFGNDAIHNLAGDPQTALTHLKYAYELAI